MLLVIPLQSSIFGFTRSKSTLIFSRNIVILFSLVVILSTAIRTLSIFISAALSARIGIDFGDMLLKRISSCLIQSLSQLIVLI